MINDKLASILYDSKYKIIAMPKRTAVIISILFLSGFSPLFDLNINVIAGIRISATNNEDDKTMINVFGKKLIKVPIIPGQNNKGTNAANVVAVDAIIGQAISPTPSLAASKAVCPCCLKR